MKKPKKVAIFDIDGTIFRSSLLIELMDALISAGIFPKNTEKKYERAYMDWVNRKGSYEKYIHKAVDVYAENIKGVRYADFLGCAKTVALLNRNRVYRHTRDLADELKKKNYHLLAISHSPREVVDDFARRLGFDMVYGRIYETKSGKFTGNILFADFIGDKAKVLERARKKHGLTLEGSIGVGDTESDISFLKKVSRPICFNPNLHLFKHAKRAGWEVVVERKDVVYKL